MLSPEAIRSVILSAFPSLPGEQGTSLPPSSASSGTNMTTNAGIPPNSHQPLRPSLTGLTVEEMMGMVLSKDCVPETVRWNTLIWEYWDIFSRAKYFWKVVRKNPESVKLWLRDTRCFLCRPCGKKYEAVLLSKTGKVTKKLSNRKQTSLGDVIDACEHYIKDTPTFSSNQRLFTDLWDNPETWPMNDAMDMFMTKREEMETLETLVEYGVSITDINEILRRPFSYYYAVIQKLRSDREPTANQLNELKNMKKVYAEIDLLSYDEAESILSLNSGELTRIPKGSKEYY